MNIQAKKYFFNHFKTLSRLFIALFALGSGIATVWAATDAATLILSHKVGDSEPLLGGTISYDIALGNLGADPVTDKGYNITISNTLPVSITFVSATINPTQIKTNDSGSTVLIWDNIADLEVNEELDLSIVGSIDPAITLSESLTNTVVARMNEAPDNSLDWQELTHSITTDLQALEIEVRAIQSTADEQATGAGEYDDAADWPYQYEVTVQNNNVASTEDVVATLDLPAGVAYMGGPTVLPNPNSSSSTPTITLNEDGSLTLEWSLGTLTTAEYADPVVIKFNTAIPYKFRTADDTLAASGPFAGPMSGSIIPEDSLMEVAYEATGLYSENPTADGTTSTPFDDQTVKVTAEYLTIAKSASPGIVGIGDSVVFNINYYVSEYYTTTNVVITDILPDGMTFDSSSLFPSNIENDTPGTGQTRLTFDIPTPNTTPGNSGTIVITSTVDATYEAAPYAGQPVVSGDSLTNQSFLANDWQDNVDPLRADTGLPDSSNATVQTRKPTLIKDVKDPITGLWGDNSYGFTGDTIYFRIQFAQAADVDGKEVVIRDFLPRGMTFDASTDSYTSSGTFIGTAECTTNPTSPTVGTLNGLQYLEWRLCDVDQGSSWEGTFGATLGDTPDLEAGWIVGNFGKLSYQNTYGDGYSERDFATVDYNAPNLVLTKSATPDSGLNGGDVVDYTITVENNGDAVAYNLNLLDTVPEWLAFDSTGGSVNPGSSSFTADSGAQAGTGGILTWGQISSLAAGDSLTFSYSATVRSGVVPGQALNNIATMAYNSRSDNTGHVWNHTNDPADDNTAEKTAYIEGLTVTKTFTPDKVTIGDIVTWTISGKVPAGVNAYFPVVEENNLPQGFDLVTGSTNVINATLVPTSTHTSNPLEDGNQDIRWFLESIDNSGANTAYTFTIEFQTLFTGVKGTNVNQAYHTNNCRNYTKKNTAYIGWYSSSTGYSNQNQAEDNINTSYDYKSPAGTASIRLRQPCLTIAKTSQYSSVGAGGQFYYDLTISNNSEKPAYDVMISDSLPEGLTFNSLNPISITPAPAISGHSSNNEGTATELEFSIDEIPASGTATIRYYVNIAADISASLSLVNLATIDSYSTKPGTPADSNGDTLPDERTYSGPTATKTIYTYDISIRKASSHPEQFTFGSTIFYTLTIPNNSNGINAVMYDVTVTDQLPSGMVPVSTSHGLFDGNVLTADYAQINKFEQKTIVIEAMIPLTSTLTDGDSLVNAGTVTTDQDSKSSNTVVDTISAPALVVEKTSDLFVVSTGDTLNYTVKVKNVGSGTAYNISVSDVLPANQTFLAGEDGLWAIAELASGQEETFTFSTSVDSATQGVAYTNSVFATGEDSQGNEIPADNSSRVPADTDPLDLSKATVYGGPLVCNSEIKNVAFEDLKNEGWSDWDYNDLIVKVETELCFTPAVAPQTRSSNLACSDVTIEAEAATLAGFTLVADAGASGGQYIHTADTPDAFDPSDPESATSAEFTFTVTVPGRYKFTGIAEGTSVFADSFWFKINNEAAIQWQVPRDAGLVADDVADFVNNIDPYTFDLAAGDHTIIIYEREDGARLDNLTMVCEGASETYEPNTLATATITYTAGARGSTFNHSLKHTLDTEGSGQANWTLYSSADAALQTGRSNFDEVADFTVIPDTMEALPPYKAAWYDAQTNTRTDQPTYTEGQWAVLSISLDNPAANPKDGLQALPWDVYLPVDDTGEEVHLLVPGHLDNTQAVLGNYDATSPLLGQSLPLGFSFEEEWHWGTEFEGIWKAYPSYVNFIESGRSESLDWYYLQNSIDWFIWENHYGSDVPFNSRSANISSRYQGTPTVADLKGDGSSQIIVGDVLANEVKVFSSDQTLLWRAATEGGIRGTVAVGNLDSDAQQELVAIAEDGKLYGWNHDGTVLSGYPIQIIEGRLISAPALADIDGDNELEIIISASNGRLYVREADGSAKWNASLGDIADSFGNQSTNSSPAVADIDGDNDFEILVGSYDQCLYAFDHTGNQLWKSCTGDIIVSTPAVGEVAPDSPGSEIVFGSGDGYIYVLTKDGAVYWKRETGNIIQASPLLADINGNGFNDVIIGSDDDKLHARDFGGDVIDGWPQATAGDIVGKATLGDIDQDGEDEIIVGSNGATINAFEKDGSLVSPGWPKETDASVRGSTIIINIDDDAELEVIAADFKGNLFIWQSEDNIAQIFLPLVGR